MADPLSIASGVAGLVTLAAQVTKLTYNYVSDMRNASRKQKEYLSEISALTSVLLQTEQACCDLDGTGLVGTRPASLTHDILEQCRTQLMTLQTNLEKQGNFKTLLWPLKERDMAKGIESLQRFRAVFSDFVTANAGSVTVATFRGVDSLVARQDIEQLRAWVGVEDGQPTVPIPAAHPGTGLWLFSTPEYQRWRNDEKPPILWCHGPPGVGKSVLSAMASDRLLEERRGCVLRHFCDYARQGPEDLMLVVRSLLGQIIDQADRDTIAALKRERDSTRSLLRADQATAILSTMCSRRLTFLFLDGLDELAAPASLLKLAHQLHNQECRVCISSRDIPAIRESLAQHQELNINATKGDLGAYIRTAFAESEFGKKLLRNSDSYDNMVRVLVGKANGVFLLAKFYVERLLACTTIKGMRKCLEALPLGLVEAYETSIQRIERSAPGDSELAFRAISWVAHAERLLTMSGLLHGLAVEEDLEGEDIDEDNVADPSRLLKVCVGLVTWDRGDDTVRMIHTSAYEVFRGRNWEAAQEDLARSCILYLSAQSLVSGPCDSWPQLIERIRTLPFLIYAAAFWAKHAQQCEAVLAPLIARFLADQMLRGSSLQALRFPVTSRGEQMIEEESFCSPKALECTTSLHTAAFWNLSGTVSRLLTGGDDVFASDSDGRTPLHSACHAGPWGRGTEVVKKLVQAGADLEARDSSERTPLILAAGNGLLDVVHLLLLHGANHLSRDAGGATPVAHAVLEGAVGVVDALLLHHETWRCSTRGVGDSGNLVFKSLTYQTIREYARLPTKIRGLDVTPGVDDGGTYEALKIEEGSLFTISPAYTTAKERRSGYRLWMDYPWNAEQDLQGPTIWDTELQLQIRCSDLASTQEILDHDNNANINHRFAQAPLHIAALRKNSAFVSALLKRGADPALTDAFGRTPLHIAIINGRYDSAAALLQGGADPNARVVSQGWTPLMLVYGFIAAEPGGFDSASRMARLLLQLGADVKVRDYRNRSIAYYAVGRCQVNEFEFLMSKGAELDPVGDEGQNVLHRLASTDVAEMCWGKRDVDDFLGLLRERDLAKTLDTEFASDTPLSFALAESNFILAEALYNEGFKLPSKELDLETLMRNALGGLQLRGMRLIMKLGGEPDMSALDEAWNTKGRPPPSPEDLKELLAFCQQRGWDINALVACCWSRKLFGLRRPFVSKCRPIVTMVTEVDSRDHTQVFLNAGADVFYHEPAADPFFWSALADCQESLQCLVSHAQRNPQSSHWTAALSGMPLIDESDGGGPLSYFCRALKEKGLLDAPLIDDHGQEYSLLYLATTRSNKALVTELLAHGASPHMAAPYDWQPLHVAALRGRKSIVRALLQHGANIHATTSAWGIVDTERRFVLDEGDAWSGTPLHCAAIHGENSNLVAFLLENGADVNAKTFEGAWAGNDSPREGGEWDEESPSPPFRGPTALHLVLSTPPEGVSYYERCESQRNYIAMILVEHGACIDGVADHLEVQDAAYLGQDLWDRLRHGISHEREVDLTKIELL